MKEYKMIAAMDSSIVKVVEEINEELDEMMATLRGTQHVSIISHDILEVGWVECGKDISGFLLSLLIKIEAR